MFLFVSVSLLCLIVVDVSEVHYGNIFQGKKKKEKKRDRDRERQRDTERDNFVN